MEESEVRDRLVCVIAFSLEGHGGASRAGAVDEVERGTEEARECVGQGKPFLISSAVASSSELSSHLDALQVRLTLRPWLLQAMPKARHQCRPRAALPKAGHPSSARPNDRDRTSNEVLLFLHAEESGQGIEESIGSSESRNRPERCWT